MKGKDFFCSFLEARDAGHTSFFFSQHQLFWQPRIFSISHPIERCIYTFFYSPANAIYGVAGTIFLPLIMV